MFCLACDLVATYLWPRNRALGRSWMLLVTIGYVVLGLPWTANAVANRLPLLPASDSWRSLDTEIVLAGDNLRGRARRAGEVFSVAAPREVWLLGDEQSLNSLLEAGIPRAQIRLVLGDPTTRHQMIHVHALIEAGQLGRTAIIASRLQMPRVAALAHTLDLDVVLIASPVDTESPTVGLRRFVPTFDALRVSKDALYEHAALRYYSWRGWTN